MRTAIVLVTIMAVFTSMSVAPATAWARYYEPQTGRFLQTDPAPGKLDIPASVVNRYAYAANNPANIVDPSGRFGFLAALLVVTAVSAVVSAVEASFQGGGYWNNFLKDFTVNEAVSVAALTVSAVGAGASLTSFSDGPFAFSGLGVTGPNAGAGGGFSAGFFQGGTDATLLHELGHTAQFIAFTQVIGPKIAGSTGAQFWGAGQILGAGAYGALGLTSFGLGSLASDASLPVKLLNLPTTTFEGTADLVPVIGGQGFQGLSTYGY